MDRAACPLQFLIALIIGGNVEANTQMHGRAKPKRGLHLTHRLQEQITAWVCLLPWVIGFLAFTLGPMLYSFGLGFFKSDMFSKPAFVGVDNYVGLAGDPLFIKSLKVTAIYAFASVPLGIVVALIMSLILNQKVIMLSVWRTVYYMPSLISGVALSVLWLQLFNPNAGVINNFLRLFGINGPAWLYSQTWALPALIFMSLWGTGSSVLLYLAGLQGIPTPLYEAAKIDGAGALQRFWKVTLPMLTPTVFFNLLMGLIGAFQFFTQSFVMTRGGPNNATLSMVLYLYRKAFEQLHFGYASAIAWVLFAVIVVFTLILLRTSNRWVFYEGELRR